MATQTFNPSATWHTTSQYQENGDPSDATVGAAVTGEDAMDNLAYLTGDKANTQVRQLGTVADLTALKAVASGSRRDQDYLFLDSNKRLYQFDSASAATGDDYSVVQPSSGTGRWILCASAVPKNTTKRWVVSAVAMTNSTAAGNFTDPTPASGRVLFNGSNCKAWAEFEGFNAGDVISEIEVCGNANVGGGGGNIAATFYQVSAADGATSPTVTSLGTVTITAGTGNAAQQSTAAPLPITIPDGTSAYKVVAEVSMTLGGPDSVYLYWVALNGTRSYITE